MLAQTNSEHASKFQTATCFWLLACGASRAQWEVLNKAGFTLSYRSAIRKVKQLGLEKLEKIVHISRSRAFLLLWDNLNIAFRVGEQRQGSIDHFDNGTTATLIPLHGVKFGELTLDLLPLRTRRLPVLDFKRHSDILPPLDVVKELEASELWHIEDILFDAFPELRKRFGTAIGPPPSVRSIPLHKTEQYPLPTMHIDESSLDGTIEVFETIFGRVLKMTDEDLQKIGIILCAGDQLSCSLLDKVYT